MGTSPVKKVFERKELYIFYNKNKTLFGSGLSRLGIMNE